VRLQAVVKNRKLREPHSATSAHPTSREAPIETDSPEKNGGVVMILRPWRRRCSRSSNGW
jgi:hypothetical protein